MLSVEQPRWVNLMPSSTLVDCENDGPARPVVVLQRRPGLAEVDGLVEYHLLRPGGVEHDGEVILQLERLAERQRDGDDGTPTQLIPGHRLPPGRQVGSQ